MGKTAAEVREEIELARDDLGDTIDAIGEKVSPRRIAQRRAEKVRNSATHLRERIMGSAESGYGTTSAKMGDAVGTLQSGASGAVEFGKDAPHKIEQQTQGNPIAAGLVAFGFGLGLASLLPETPVEARQAREIRRRVVEPVKEGVTEAGRNIAGDLKDSAKESAEAVKATATDSAGQIKEDVQRSVADVTEGAQTAAATVKENVNATQTG